LASSIDCWSPLAAEFVADLGGDFATAAQQQGAHLG
jgi:hypothetical protein